MPAAPIQRPPADVPTQPTVPVVGPNPPHRRMLLLFKLLVVPVAVVCLPSLFVSYFFGQRPQPKTPPEAAFSALRDSLERAARERLPEGTPAFGAQFEDLTLPCPAAEIGARREELQRTAANCGGGTVIDQGGDAAGHHLLVELPAAFLPTFRARATHLESPAEPPRAPDHDARAFLRVTLASPAAPAAP